MLRLAQRAFDGLAVRHQIAVERYLHGVVSGVTPDLEEHTDALRRAYAPVRAALRAKYGATVRVYRGEPTRKPQVERRWLSWTPSRKLAEAFAWKPGYHVVEATVKVADVVAVLVSPHNRDYIEFLVRERRSYHRKARRLPYVCSIWLDSRKLFATFERALALAGGKLLTIVGSEGDDQIRRLTSAQVGAWFDREYALVWIRAALPADLVEERGAKVGRFELDCQR